MIKIFESAEAVANKIAEEMNHYLIENENPVFCLASGSTPQKSYEQFAKNVGEEKKNLKIVSLDEWVGISRDSEGSCYQMLNKDLFSLLQLEKDQIEFFDGTSQNLQEECARIDHFIENNPITFSLMGLGMNGHIGLNEPGSPVLNNSSIVKLSETTKTVAQKYFDQPTHLEEGITLGLKQIINSKRVVVAITGEHKAEIVKEIIENQEAKLPAQELLGYDHIDFYLDADAAKYIKKGAR
ncbi:6-phosphogluconolactonase [Lederbergia wuyishanensis]|uniref:6-phosphogluconolactonase/glucosamine-6-phosphate isomerase/deaminase n=1 Tax=Lederbergia wuyishanensis TaxID=1347903 RepID=A0ABU0D9L3_9BACI|nr:6-phosphogluconolactonase [Lederbergia wuyishanensis]MCJ8007449.1 6-phosphogluconolactonase [Lederbergia wuyishanensis]MDQ0345112.1 6-phosphogluconolactonase/glucosamine-6-phosphate isomerase/deaminase [Lederbergia wuyishanensis]